MTGLDPSLIVTGRDGIPSPSGCPERRTLAQAVAACDFRQAGERMHGLIAELYPICRSITGDGFRETLRRIHAQIPLLIREVPTGTRAFDWTVPREWNIRDAWVKSPAGEKVIDFRRSNLHVVNYSVPVRRRMPLSELRQHLHSLPDQPDLIPYRTSYYKESWGFCLRHRELLSLADGDYEVCIDSSLEDGSLCYGEYFLPGESSDEVLLSCHACHPSLCNDNLSGVALVTALAGLLTGAARKYSYRFLFIPGCIGSIVWLSQNEEIVNRIRHGLVVACVGDSGKFHYKRSRRGDAEIDRATVLALQHGGTEFEVRDFSPYGYDERQYCSPGFNLAVGSLTRTPHGRFSEYHTSADNLDLVSPEALAGSLQTYLSVIGIVENNRRYQNLNPNCEPQLGRRGIYRALGGLAEAGNLEMAMLWVLNLCDGNNALLDIAEKSGLPFESIRLAAHTLKEHDLLCELQSDAQLTGP
jgi:aminopeptidase-like protein